MKRWIIRTAAMSALALPLVGQVRTDDNAKLDEAKREADQRDGARRVTATLDVTGAPGLPAAPQPTNIRGDVVIEQLGVNDLVVQANVVKVFHLHNSKAGDIAKLINDAFSGGAQNPKAGGIAPVGSTDLGVNTGITRISTGSSSAGSAVAGGTGTATAGTTGSIAVLIGNISTSNNPFQPLVGKDAANKQPLVTAAADEKINAVVVTGPGNVVNQVGSIISEIDVKKEKVAYLGVITSSAAPSLREQLKLGKGVGLVVDSIEPKTAAETAGIKQHDVLEKLNDQLLINTEQFTAVLRTMKVGDEVTLSLVRQGERQAIKAKLGEKEIESGAAMAFEGFARPAIPPTPATPGFGQGVILFDDRGNPPAAIPWAAQLNTMTPGTPGMAGVFVQTINGKQTTQWADDQFHISLDRDGDKVTKVTVSDTKTGKLIMTGMPPAADDPIFKTMPQLQTKIKKAEEASNAQPQFVVTGGVGGPVPVAGGRGKVVQWQDADHVMMMRLLANKPLYLLALSKKDGRTLYDGPVMTDEQRQSVPAEISEQFELLSAHPETAKEFGGPANTPKAAKPGVIDPAPTAPPGGGGAPGSVPRFGAPAATPAAGEAPVPLPPVPAPAK